MEDMLKTVLDQLQQAQIPYDKSGPSETVISGELAGLAVQLLRRTIEPNRDLWIQLDEAIHTRDAQLADEESKAQLHLWSTVVHALVWRNVGIREAYLEDLHWAVVIATSTNESEMLRGIFAEIAPMLVTILEQARRNS